LIAACQLGSANRFDGRGVAFMSVTLEKHPSVTIMKQVGSAFDLQSLYDRVG